MASRIWDTKEIRRKDVSVGELYKTMHEKTKLQQINGDIGHAKLITDKNVHRPGLAQKQGGIRSNSIIRIPFSLCGSDFGA